MASRVICSLLLASFHLGVAQLPTVSTQMPALPARPGPQGGIPAQARPVPALSPEEAEKQQKRLKNRKLIDEFFAGPVVRLEIDFEPQEWEELKRANREYALATMVEVAPDGKRTTYKNVSVKLKGAAGSFQPPDQKPGLTIHMTKEKGGERFHGMKKFHLNNGAQDNSLLNEYLSGELCRALMVPASRCTHAFVKWQGREMGIYVFKETFNEDMFSYFYEKTDGSLYDGHFICEIDDEKMEKQEGDPNDRKDIQGLAEACKEPDPKLRWKKLEERLDVSEFIRFLAMETLASHWDGYNYNLNNYRVYFDSKTGKAAFFAHGMDQTWGQPNFSLLRDPKSLVGNAVLSNPAWRTHYRKVQEEVYNRFMKSNEWDIRLLRQGRKVQDAIARWNSPKAGREYIEQVAAIKERMKARIDALKDQFPRPFDSNATVMSVGTKGWHSDGNGTLDEVVEDGQKAYHIRSDGNVPGSWRVGGILPAGKYRFQAKVKVADVGTGGDNFGEGAGLRVSGSSRKGKNGATGTANWQQINFDFESPGGEIVLIAELSSKGDAWFARSSLSLVRMR